MSSVKDLSPPVSSGDGFNSEDVKHFSGFDDTKIRALTKMLSVKNSRINFALNHHVNTSGEPMEFDNYPHIKSLYNTLAFEVVLMASVQTFKSEWAIIDHFAMAYNGLSVFYVLPKFEMRTTYVQNRINRCVQNVKEYKKIIGAGFFDSVAIKNFGAGVIKYVGSNVISDFREYPADVLFIDEVDECDKDNVALALDRLRASKYQFKRYLGNPDIKGKGIHAFFKRSDQREWEVPCFSCGEYSELDWFKVVTDEVIDNNGNVVDYILRDRDWKIGHRRDIKCICPNCGGELERASKKGKWIPRNPDSAIEGYHISMLCSPINTISGMWERFRRALNDPGAMKKFWNSELGLAYDAVGNRVTTNLLDRCVDLDYEIAIRPNCAHLKEDFHTGPCSMGVDVGKILDVRLSCFGSRGQRKLIYVAKIKALNMEELFDIVVRYNVEKAVIDAAPELMLALDFQEGAECDVWLCRYGGEGSDRQQKHNLNDRVISIDRTEALDRTYSQFRSKRNILPFNYRDILNGEFVEEMCMPVRKIGEDSKGNPKYEWTKGKDHQRHADTYDFLAFQMMNDLVISDATVG